MGTLHDVGRGMRVIDSLGQDVGVVDHVARATESRDDRRARRLPSGLARALRSATDVHPQTASRMLRGGYVRIAGPGSPTEHGYAAADHVGVVAAPSRGTRCCAGERPV